MELKEFVKATLEQIVEGVASAQESMFDVGLTATDKRGSAEGIGVFLGSISLGKKNETGVEQVVITKVRFSVPLVLPLGPKLFD